MKLFKLITYCLLFFLLPFWLQAQLESPSDQYQANPVNNRSFDEDRWSNMVNNTDFSERFNERNIQKKQTTRSRDGEIGQDFEPSSSEENNTPWSFTIGKGSTLLKFLLIILAVIGLVFLLRALIGSEGKGRNKAIRKKQQTIVDLERIEENLEETDPEQFLKQVIDEGNYKLAIRLYYLSVLRNLSAQKLIRWKKDKTNRDYLSEMYTTTHYRVFKEVTTIFERVWYGNKIISQQQFKTIVPKFEALIKDIKP